DAHESRLSRAPARTQAKPPGTSARRKYTHERLTSNTAFGTGAAVKNLVSTGRVGLRCARPEGSIGTIRRDARGAARRWTLVPAPTCVVALAAPAIGSGVRHRRAARHARPSTRPSAARGAEARPRRPPVAGPSDPTLVHVHVRRGDTLWAVLA